MSPRSTNDNRKKEHGGRTVSQTAAAAGGEGESGQREDKRDEERDGERARRSPGRDGHVDEAREVEQAHQQPHGRALVRGARELRGQLVQQRLRGAVGQAGQHEHGPQAGG
eukprot:CAMPEP_0202055734 /NCGR_PEP_ID=MMETSP0963-20130614/20088_1 /ASSEMBLY_ACC=CAM_ASM_000494 /TAXON_ID=4773 /ORGANISM="Schizochytrium aggregatum, Strain ATCC28209" /LENGTH=110 /DNA_ID=CAMNT_0048621373 /DNA_START=119 /DNA_END=447 /DNA_ORIENTATION=+